MNIQSMRESLISWLSRSEDAVKAVWHVRKNIDQNMRKPAMPAGWRPLHQVAADRQLDPGHLARICRLQLAPLEQARICLYKGRQTWCIHPDAIANLPTHRATDAPSSGISISGPDGSATPAPRVGHAGSAIAQIEGGSK